MDWQQKAEALAGLCELRIKYREREWRIGSAEPWYIEQSIYVTEAGASTMGGKFGNGLTPVSAIEDHWKVLVEELGPREYLIVGSSTTGRRAVKWNGFMWADYPEPQTVKAA